MKKSMRNQVVVNEEDIISQLPEVLILQILSLLPTKDVIATTVLSKQWRFLWKMVPKLIFDSNDHGSQLGTFANNVCKSLLSHKAPILQSLHLEVDLDTCTAMDIGILLGIAFGRSVRELSLDAYHEKKNEKSFIFPTSFFTCETLETLILRFLVLVDVPSQICLKSLKTLHLDYMNYKDDSSVFNLLSGCPCLETLVFRQCTYGGDMKIFTIAVPSLKSLSICDENSGEEHQGYLIKAPYLKYLHIDVWNDHKFLLIVNYPELVKAHIFCKTINLGSLTSVKILSLLLWSPLEVTYPSDSIFYRLVYLELYTGKPAWWNLLTFMLETSPKLKVLKLLIDQWHTIEDNMVCENWNQPENVPECLLFHLEKFVWEGYKGKQQEETEVAKYILKNASCLKKATFFRIDSSLKEKSERLDELKSVVMASKSCKLVFE